MGIMSTAQARKLGIKVPERKAANKHPAANVSHLEELLVAQMEAAGLPTPEREVKFSPDRNFLADFLWPEHRLIVEVQGGTKWGKSRHSYGRGFRSDCEKAAEAVLCGYYLVPVSSGQVKDGSACEAVADLLAHLQPGDRSTP